MNIEDLKKIVNSEAWLPYRKLVESNIAMLNSIGTMEIYNKNGELRSDLPLEIMVRKAAIEYVTSLLLQFDQIRNLSVKSEEDKQKDSLNNLVK